MYSRFFTKFLYDIGMLPCQEPFTNLLTQGMVLKDGAKMSKSKGNIVSPEEIIGRYGADTARLFILFASPPERDLEWSDQGVEGSYRFLNRVWRQVTAQAEKISQLKQQAKNFSGLAETDRALHMKTHATIKKVSVDIEERFNFNTAISAIMELSNALNSYSESGGQNLELIKEAVDTMLLLLSPFCPHICEELWQLTGHAESIYLQSWPQYDPAALVEDEVEIVLQVNGRVRDKINVPTQASDEDLRRISLENQKIRELTNGKKIVKMVVVPGKLVNIVIK